LSSPPSCARPATAPPQDACPSCPGVLICPATTAGIFTQSPQTVRMISAAGF
jgi:hypothetical protein